MIIKDEYGDYGDIIEAPVTNVIKKVAKYVIGAGIAGAMAYKGRRSKK